MAVSMWRRFGQKLWGAAGHQHAHYALSVVSFLDSSVLPVSPLLLLLPMSVAKPHKSWWYVTTCSFYGALGAGLGYAIGYFLMGGITPYLQEAGYWEKYLAIMQDMQLWGLWLLWLAVFLPIPYKLFAIAAGFLQLPFLPFVVLTFGVRWLHFAIIPLTVYWMAKAAWATAIRQWLSHYAK